LRKGRRGDERNDGTEIYTREKCWACKSVAWVERPAYNGGGIVCGRCHPLPPRTRYDAGLCRLYEVKPLPPKRKLRPVFARGTVLESSP